MNVLIISSASEEIEDKYLKITQKIASFLANNNCNLVFGAASFSMMGICYQEFRKKNRKIYAFTTKKYQCDLIQLPETEKRIFDTTFELKKALFESSDCILCLPGGVGTLSELLAFIEEKRSGDQDKPIIIYNEDHFYQNFLKQLEVMKNNQFIKGSVYETFKVVHHMNELEQLLIEEIRKERKI